MRPYSNTSSIIIFDATFFKPRYLVSVYYSIFSFIIIATNVGAEFRGPICITFHRRFPFGVKNASISRPASYATTCQYPQSMSIAII